MNNTNTQYRAEVARRLKELHKLHDEWCLQCEQLAMYLCPPAKARQDQYDEAMMAVMEPDLTLKQLLKWFPGPQGRKP